MEHMLYSCDDELIIAPMNYETSECYRVLRNRPDNMSFFFSQKEISSEEQKRWYSNYINDSSQYMFSIFEKESKLFLGGIGVYEVCLEEKSCEVGRIIIDKLLAAGKGYGAKAICQIVSLAHRELGVDFFYAYIYEENIASIKSFLKAGFCVDYEFCERGIIKVTLLKKGTCDN